MAFTAITSGEITSGQPVATTTQTKIKDNFDDHETRLEAMESFNAANPPIIFRVNGQYPVATDVTKTTSNFAFNIAGVRILVDQAGSSGTVQIDIKRKRGAGSFTSIFTVLPSVAYSAGNDALSTNAVLDSGVIDLVAGDILRLDITSAQVSGSGFLVRIDYNRV